MVKEVYFSKSKIEELKRFHNADPILIEKTLYAFELLGNLTKISEDFIFKGGTSLILHLDTIQRLSIDIDIIYFGNNLDSFINNLNQIIENTSPFKKLEKDNRGHAGLPKRKHFKFYYYSEYTDQDQYIMLDIVEDENVRIPEDFVMKKTISTPFFEVDETIAVKVLTPEALIGDKLTAYAPHTIGVPFTRSQNVSLQAVKQLFDVGQLFNIVKDFNQVKKAYNFWFNLENSYRNNQYQKDECLEDIISTSKRLLEIRLKGFNPDELSQNIEEGIRRLQSHLTNAKFRTDVEAKIAAARALYLATCIKNNLDLDFDFEKDGYTSNKEIIKQANFNGEYAKFNKLKQIAPEAFYYLWKAQQINIG